MREKRISRRREQRRRAAAALKQRISQTRFERADVFAHGRLRDLQSSGRSSEATVLRRGYEDFQLSHSECHERRLRFDPVIRTGLLPVIGSRSIAPARADDKTSARSDTARGHATRGIQVRRVLHEPLFQFLLLGAVLFAGTQMIARHTALVNRQVVVDAAVEQRLAKLYELQMGAMPSRAQLDTLVEHYIHDEILYREALRAGLDRDDEIIRRRLIQKIEFLDEDLAAIPEPSEQALKAFYRTHLARFTAQPTVTFNHVYFSPDATGSQAARRRAEAARVVLQSRSRTDGQGVEPLGDPSPLPSTYTDLDEPDALRLFGQTPIVHELFAQPTGTWAGPFRSGYGWHLIRVTQRTSDAVEPFESARERVKQDYVAHAKQEANRQRYEQSRARYVVVHDGNAALADTIPVARLDNAE
jgi:hypothetical protein